MIEYNPNIRKVTAFAPATCANVAVGFDILGFPFKELGDQVTLERHDFPGIRVKILGDINALPLDPNKNVASAVIQRFCHDHQLDCHFTVSIQKGIPIGSGMGGSAASAVAALTALNDFLSIPLDREQWVNYAAYGEEIESNADLAADCILTIYSAYVSAEKTGLEVPIKTL